MGLLDVHPGLILWTIITFVVVLVILKAKVWGPLLTALDQREQSIREAIESADKARADTQAQLQEHRQTLIEAEVEARQIVAEAREAAETVRQSIVDAARVEAQRTIDSARKSIETEKRTALAELHNEVADLAVNAASKILDAELDADRNRKLVNDFITRLPQS
ncbi:MAG: F0F1 ATP synthase subunit B [Candidatus Latescibacterota bacterium]|nr:F0F1 ATP synthase subunit B [Candidatus Latescibacterota bacterium]